jgi:hypothetical protein
VRHVAGEFSGPVNRDGLRRVAGFVDDLGLTGLDHEKLELSLADLEKRLSVRVLLQKHPCAAPQLFDLCLVERGERDSAQIMLGHVSTSSLSYKLFHRSYKMPLNRAQKTRSAQGFHRDDSSSLVIFSWSNSQPSGFSVTRFHGILFGVVT